MVDFPKILDILRAFPGQDIWLWEMSFDKDPLQTGLYRALPDGGHELITWQDICLRAAQTYKNPYSLRDKMLRVYWMEYNGRARLLCEPWRVPRPLKRPLRGMRIK